MRSLGMIERQVPTDVVRIVVEDARPESELLQINNPAPRDGFFSPSVRLGQEVTAGDLLGTIADPLENSVEQVLVKNSGLVILLRIFPRVLQGECLAIILEIGLNEGTLQ